MIFFIHKNLGFIYQARVLQIGSLFTKKNLQGCLISNTCFSHSGMIQKAFLTKPFTDFRLIEAFTVGCYLELTKVILFIF